MPRRVPLTHTLPPMGLGAITFDHLGTPEQMNALTAIVARHAAPATFFVTGEQAAQQPEAVRALHEAGYEVGMHGWAHEQWSQLDERTERALATRATDAIGEATGAAPTGFRAPGGERTARTAELLSELGYGYDASLSDTRTAAALPNGLPNVPFVWPGVDGYWYLRDSPSEPSAVRDAWIGAIGRPLFVTICHPEITATDEARLAALDAVVRHACGSTELYTIGAIAARLG